MFHILGSHLGVFDSQRHFPSYSLGPRGAGRYFALVRQNERGSGGPPPEKFEI